MKIEFLLSVLVGMSWLLPVEAKAQQDSSRSESSPLPAGVTVTHWSRNVELFWSHESVTWDKNSFDDAGLIRVSWLSPAPRFMR